MATAVVRTAASQSPQASRRLPRGSSAQAVRFVVLLTASLLAVLPLWLMVVGAGRKTEDIAQGGWTALDPVGFPELGANVRRAIDAGFVPALAVTTAVTLLTVAAGLVVNSLAGYALARLPVRGRRALLLLVVALVIVPFEAIVAPLFLLSVQPVAGHRLSDTIAAQVLPFIAQPLHIFLFYSFFRGLPVEVEEAAQIDGAGTWRTFRSIVAPLAAPAYASSAVLMFLQMWGQYLWPFNLTSGRLDLQPLPIAMQNFLGTTSNYGPFYAFAAMSVLPVVAVFLALQRWFVQGIAAGAVKG